MKKSGDSTHHCRSPTLNGYELTLSTGTQSSEQEYSYLTASKRWPATPYSHNPPPKLFTRNPAIYFSEVDKTCAYKSLTCCNDFSKICWRVELCSVELLPWQKLHWVSSSFGSIIFAESWHTLFLGGLAKRCRGSWFIHSCLCMGTINLLIFRHPYKTRCHLTHASQPNHPAFQGLLIHYQTFRFLAFSAFQIPLIHYQTVRN